MADKLKLKMKHEFNKYLNYGIAPFATSMTMVAGFANQGMTNFLFAAPSFIVAALILIDKDRTEHKISKRIIITGLILATYVGISRFQGGKLFYPANGKELTARALLCIYSIGIEDGKQIYKFDKVNSPAECLQQHNSNMLIEKGEKVKVTSTTVHSYFFAVNHWASVSTKYGEASYSGNGEYFLMDGKIFDESDIKNSFLIALAFMMIFPFCLISPYLYYRYHSYLHSPNKTV